MPLIRSESWAFIWHPNVVTWYRRIRTPRSSLARYSSRDSRRVVARLSRMTVTLIWPGYSSSSSISRAISCESSDGLVVVDLARLHDDADLAAGLERIDLLDARCFAASSSSASSRLM